MKKKPCTLTIAACAPAAYGFAPEQYFPLIQGVIDGQERDPARIAMPRGLRKLTCLY